MTQISKEFNNYCKSRYASFGFIKCGNTFARICGDVLQVFNLKTYHVGNLATVEFGIIPLCIDLPVILQQLPSHILKMGTYVLDYFFVDIHANSGGWVYDPCSDQSILNCVAEITQAIDDYLIPFFQKCIDCASSLFQLLKLEGVFEQNRIAILNIHGQTDHAAPLINRVLFDSKKYFMALKAHNYEYALCYLQHQVNYHKNELHKLHERTVPNQSDIIIQKHYDRYNALETQLNWLQSDNTTNFDELIEDNESAMRKVLSKKYPKLFKKTGDGTLS